VEGQPRHEYEIDGAEFSSWEELSALLDPIFADAGLVPAGFRTGSFDGLDEVLGGWFNEQKIPDDYWPPGKPESFVIRWKNSATSRERLGSPLESIADKKRELSRFSTDPLWANWSHKKASMRKVRKEIRQMKRGKKVDPTAFELVVDIFRSYAPGGPNMENDKSGVILLLE
jgi:hypothetical protein